MLRASCFVLLAVVIVDFFDLANRFGLGYSGFHILSVCFGRSKYSHGLGEESTQTHEQHRYSPAAQLIMNARVFLTVRRACCEALVDSAQLIWVIKLGS